MDTKDVVEVVVKDCKETTTCKNCKNGKGKKPIRCQKHGIFVPRKGTCDNYEA